MLRIEDVERARERIAGRVVRTPVLAFDGITLKAELFQVTGSFKIRGVLNTLAQLSPAQRAVGFVSISAGNHAAALAKGATELGAKATIVMPSHAQKSKIIATEAYGGEVVLTDGDLMQTMREIQGDRTFVHPFDDLGMMGGHGTIGLEILEDVPSVEAVVVPIGGGGLIGGVATAIKARAPHVKVFGVEPEGADTMARSLVSGVVEHIKPSSIADGLCAPFTGVHTLEHVKAFVDEVVRVPDDAIAQALRVLVERAKLAAEPAGAACLAPMITGALSYGPGTVAIVSGGNIDRARLKELL